MSTDEPRNRRAHPTKPGAQVALKVYVILTTGNEAGSAAMIVQRPSAVLPLAA